MDMSFPYVTDIINSLFGTTLFMPIPTFGLCVALAIMAASAIARNEVVRYQSSGALQAGAVNALERAIFGSIFLGIVGARLFSILDYPVQFLNDPWSMIFARNGLSIYGGLLFGIGAGLLILKRNQIPVVPMLDVISPALLLGYAIGRIGCQLSGDGDWGIVADMGLKPTWVPDWLWAQTYQGNIAGVTIALPGVYPTPIYETGMALASFGLMWCLRKSKQRPGFLFSIYLLMTGFARLLIEKIRVNVRYNVIGLSFTQAEAISCVIILAGLVGVLITLRTRSAVIKGVVAFGIVAALSACTLR
jgi:phosphatidylglycerol:prolipoprotein diacylglycerol transferase